MPAREVRRDADRSAQRGRPHDRPRRRGSPTDQCKGTRQASWTQRGETDFHVPSPLGLTARSNSHPVNENATEPTNVDTRVDVFTIATVWCPAVTKNAARRASKKTIADTDQIKECRRMLRSNMTSNTNRTSITGENISHAAKSIAGKVRPRWAAWGGGAAATEWSDPITSEEMKAMMPQVTAMVCARTTITSSRPLCVTSRSAEEPIAEW